MEPSRSSAARRSCSRNDSRHPGVGIETRTSSGSDALLAVYTVAGLAPLVALAASWKWPLVAGWIGVVAGVLWMALGALDLGGILGAAPPPGMIVVDAVLAIIGVAVALGSLACDTPLSSRPGSTCRRSSSPAS
jgi:hypothetical protein